VVVVGPGQPARDVRARAVDEVVESRRVRIAPGAQDNPFAFDLIRQIDEDRAADRRFYCGSASGHPSPLCTAPCNALVALVVACGLACCDGETKGIVTRGTSKEKPPTDA